MFVRVFGPNLSGPAQRKGEFHVHDEGCGDSRFYGPDARYGGDGPEGWAMEVQSRTAIAEHLYSDQIAEHADEPGYVETCLATLWFAPCCSALPVGLSEPNAAQKKCIEETVVAFADHKEVDLIQWRVIDGGEFAGDDGFDPRADLRSQLFVEFSYRYISEEKDGRSGREVHIIAEDGSVFDAQDFG